MSNIHSVHGVFTDKAIDPGAHALLEECQAGLALPAI